MLSKIWSFSRQTILAFIEDEALTRGAAISFYTVTSIAPLLLIVVAIAGLAFGQDAAQGAITNQLSSLMGPQTAELLEQAVASAAGKSAGVIATIIGIATLLLTASGAFGELQAALNVVWKAKPEGNTVSRLLRARAASLGLVATLGFLLVISLAASAAVTAFGERLNEIFPFGQAVAAVINFTLSLILIGGLFAAVYKILPDRKLKWGDVILGAVVNALLFVIGKSLIGWYIGNSGIASTYGAAGSLIVLLLWVYYSAQTFLLGAELTKTFANREGSKAANPVH
jgi:membrane protein